MLDLGCGGGGGFVLPFLARMMPMVVAIMLSHDAAVTWGAIAERVYRGALRRGVQLELDAQVDKFHKFREILLKQKCPYHHAAEQQREARRDGVYRFFPERRANARRSL